MAIKQHKFEKEKRHNHRKAAKKIQLSFQRRMESRQKLATELFSGSTELTKN